MLIKQFKRDYFPYLIGIIVPALTGFFTIPILKSALGPARFGIFSFYLSLLLIVNASFSGGVSQSIIRLHVDYEDKKRFYSEALLITIAISFLLSIPLFLYVYNNYGLLNFAFLFIAALFLSNMYTTLLAITQSKFLSVKTAVSESVRTISFLSLAVGLLYFFPAINFLLVIFSALVISYFSICFYLLFINGLHISFPRFEIERLFITCKKFIHYGGYLVGWFLLTYAISMANRFILAQHFGKENIGHFTASFDMLNKSIVIILSPVLTSLFPLVVKANAEGEYNQVKMLIRQLIMLEGILLVVSLALYPFIGFPVLNKLLQTPPTNEYLFLEMEVIAGTFIWQMAMLQHKFLELRKRTKRMLLYVGISFLVSFTIDMFLIPKGGIFLSGIGYLSGSMCYFVLTFLSERNLNLRA